MFLRSITDKFSRVCANCYRHARRYLEIYLPNAGFEVSTTNRYLRASDKPEACIISLRNWIPGEIIAHLRGATVILTREEDAQFQANGQDFSILHSSRLNAMCLFLGPARFVNHDCHSNTTFTATREAVTLKVRKPIQKGEEVTTYYGANYFGEGNCECLCHSCENDGVGAYADMKESTEDALSVSSSQSSVSSSQRRLRSSILLNGRRNADYVIASNRFNGTSSPTPSLTNGHSNGYALLPIVSAVTPKKSRKIIQMESECAICKAHIIQDPDESYYMPYYCRRCQRHAKLYRFRWPKREKSHEADTDGMMSDDEAMGYQLTPRKKLQF